MKHKQQAIILTTLIAGFATSVQADDSAFYGYLSAGQSQSDRQTEADQVLTGAGATAFSSSIDDTDTAWKIQAGYRLTENFAIEGGYNRLGDISYSANITAPGAGAGVVRLDIDGWNLDLVGRMPFSDNFTGFAKLGAFAYDLDYQCGIISGPYSCGTASRNASGSSLHYGLGLEYAFSNNWFLRAEYEVFNQVGNAMSANGSTGTSQEDVWLGSVGIGYRF
jgi:OOP family OmpA-OmpF porin